MSGPQTEARIALATAFVLGMLAMALIMGSRAHAALQVTPAAWASMPCATAITHDAIRYTCRIEGGL